MPKRAIVIVTLLLAACGGGDPPAGDEDGASAGSESPAGEGRPIVQGEDGVPVDCPYRVADLCYDTPEAACAAAGCAPDGCQILESYPAQIRCD